ncbi:MAG TPA: hypothetical protein VD928_03555 [Candidatus Paceibacterota bacterium]|nr:hypothetical protein [Candidatus Paceibacterota bacterium]
MKKFSEKMIGVCAWTQIIIEFLIYTPAGAILLLWIAAILVLDGIVTATTAGYMAIASAVLFVSSEYLRSR